MPCGFLVLHLVQNLKLLSGSIPLEGVLTLLFEQDHESTVFLTYENPIPGIVEHGGHSICLQGAWFGVGARCNPEMSQPREGQKGQGKRLFFCILWYQNTTCWIVSVCVYVCVRYLL